MDQKIEELRRKVEKDPEDEAARQAFLAALRSGRPDSCSHCGASRWGAGDDMRLRISAGGCDWEGSPRVCLVCGFMNVLAKRVGPSLAEASRGSSNALRGDLRDFMDEEGRALWDVEGSRVRPPMEALGTAIDLYSHDVVRFSVIFSVRTVDYEHVFSLDIRYREIGIMVNVCTWDMCGIINFVDFLRRNQVDDDRLNWFRDFMRHAVPHTWNDIVIGRMGRDRIDDDNSLLREFRHPVLSVLREIERFWDINGWEICQLATHVQTAVTRRADAERRL